MRHYGLGLIQVMFTLLGVVLAFGMFVLLSQLGPESTIIAISVSVVYFLGVILVFTVAHSVFNTVLYAYANCSPPPTFDAELRAHAFQPRS